MIIFLVLLSTLSTLLMTSSAICASYTTCLACVNQTTCEYNITGSICINRPLIIHPADMYYVPLPLKRQTNTVEYATQSNQCPISRVPTLDTLHLGPLPFILDTTSSYYVIDNTTLYSATPYSLLSNPMSSSNSSSNSSYSTFVINDGSAVYHTAVQQPTTVQNSNPHLFLSLAITFTGLICLI